MACSLSRCMMRPSRCCCARFKPLSRREPISTMTPWCWSRPLARLAVSIQSQIVCIKSNVGVIFCSVRDLHGYRWSQDSAVFSHAWHLDGAWLHWLHHGILLGEYSKFLELPPIDVVHSNVQSIGPNQRKRITIDAQVKWKSNLVHTAVERPAGHSN